jgi:mRNA (guanine-N7-)-methyltransferase
MPYPKTAPKVKHKLLKLDELDTFQSSAEIFEKIDHAVMNSNSLRIKELSVIYSYDDGPDYPGPLSSGLLILGFAKQHLGLVKTVLGGTGNGPDGLHSATIAVKLADAHHFHKLPPKDQQNSTSFVQLMQQLRINNTVAVVARDKYRRFGLIVPMKKSHENITDSTDEHASAEDCAAYIHVGTVEDVKNFMTANDIEDIQTRKDTARTQGSSDASSSPSSGNKRLTDPLSNAEQKKRTKTGGSGTKWPIYRPDLGGFEDDDVDTTEWPFYQPDHGDFDDDETGDDDSDVQEPENSSSDSREHENSSGPSKTHVWGNHDINSGSNNDVDTWDATKKYGGDQEEAQATSWGINDIHDSGGHFGTSDETTNSSSVWGVTTWGTTDDNHNHPGNESSFGGNVEDDSDDRFHKDRGAAAADDFYSNLTRDQETTADSNLFHMRKFNNWVKSIQIQELDPHTGSARSGKNGRLHSKLRILDLACGKGGK